MAKKDQHVDLDDFESLHQPKGGAGGKGCLWKEQSNYEAGHQCSYRWHGREHALEDGRLYNFPAYRSLCVDHAPGKNDVFPTAAYEGKGGGLQPTVDYALRKGFGFPFKKKPRPGQWDVTLPRNFTESYARPYWHNSHHIIPDSALQKEFSEADKSDSRASALIAQGLLMAAYNLNDKANMIILPIDRAVAESLGLPRHLLGHERQPDSEEPSSRRETDHPDYTRRVRIMMRPVMSQYKRLVLEKLKEDHPEPPDALAKEQLVRISKAIYRAITTGGKFMRGQSLDELKFGGVGGR
jgi:hypothetical protein